MAEQGSWVWNPSRRLILASESSTRKRLLESCGIPFTTCPPGVDERQIESEWSAQGGDVLETPIALARAKALAVSSRAPDALCLGADQVLILDGRLFHKASTAAQAEANLTQLAGRKHQLVSAYAIAQGGAIVREATDHAELTMRSLNRDQLASYLDQVGEKALQSVGGYQIESLGIHLFQDVRGEHSTILGLPLLPLLSSLRELGALTL